MRYYDITITHAFTGDIVKRWSTIRADGSNDPAALKVNFDVFVYFGTTYPGASSLTIYGVSLDDLQQANNPASSLNPHLAGKHIEVRAGFSGGLPLEKPDQSGVLFSGTILNSVGNWVGTDMSISLMINPTVHSHDNPGNYVLNWHKGQPLSEAIAEMLDRALPGVPQEINIHDQVIAPSQIVMHDPTLDLIAGQIYRWTSIYYSHLASPYLGVQIGIKRGVIVATDTTEYKNFKQLEFEDFIGQPNWFDKFSLEFMTQLRADISIGDTVRMPSNMTDLPGFAQTRLQAYPSFHHYSNAFTGDFFIKQARHIGDSRSPDGKDWASVFIAIPTRKETGAIPYE